MSWGRGRAESPGRAVDDAALTRRLRRGERVLAAARTKQVIAASPVNGAFDVVGGTAHAIYLPDGAVLGWHEIDQAVWNDEEARLDLVTLPIDGPARAYRIELVEPGRLPELIRERVTSSIVVNQHVPIDGRRGARIIARRLPDTQDLDWIVVYDVGIDGNDPDVQQRMQHGVAVLRRDLGV